MLSPVSCMLAPFCSASSSVQPRVGRWLECCRPQHIAATCWLESKGEDCRLFQTVVCHMVQFVLGAECKVGQSSLQRITALLKYWMTRTLECMHIHAGYFSRVRGWQSLGAVGDGVQATVRWNATQAQPFSRTNAYTPLLKQSYYDIHQ